MDNQYHWNEDENGTINILQGEALLYEFDFATEAVAERAVRLLNEGKGERDFDELFDYLIADGCVESASGCMRAREDFEVVDKTLGEERLMKAVAIEDECNCDIAAGLPWTTDRTHVHNLGQVKQIVDAAIAEHGSDTPVGYSSAGNQDRQDGLKLKHFRVSELSVQFLHGDCVVKSPVNPVVDIPVFIIG